MLLAGGEACELCNDVCSDGSIPLRWKGSPRYLPSASHPCCAYFTVLKAWAIVTEQRDGGTLWRDGARVPALPSMPSL